MTHALGKLIIYVDIYTLLVKHKDNADKLYAQLMWAKIKKNTQKAYIAEDKTSLSDKRKVRNYVAFHLSTSHKERPLFANSFGIIIWTSARYLIL